MGGSGRELAPGAARVTVVLMAGLQGSARPPRPASQRHLREEHKMDVALAACDVCRPAAVDQLVKVGGQVSLAVAAHQPQSRGHRRVGIGQAKQDRRDALIVDTRGRLHIDDELMKELADIKKREAARRPTSARTR